MLAVSSLVSGTLNPPALLDRQGVTFLQTLRQIAHFVQESSIFTFGPHLGDALEEKTLLEFIL